MDRAYKSLTRRITKAVLVIGTIAIVLAAGFLITLNSLQVSFFSVSGGSMEPTLQDRDSVVLKQHKKVSKGLLVFFAKPNAWTYTDAFGQEPKILVKRIAAVPGDTIAFDGKDFLVNGEPVFNLEANSYTCPKGEVDYTHKLNDSEIFVLGDNASSSLDSRRVFCDGGKDFYVAEPLVVDFGTIALKF